MGNERNDGAKEPEKDDKPAVEPRRSGWFRGLRTEIKVALIGAVAVIVAAAIGAAVTPIVASLLQSNPPKSVPPPNISPRITSGGTARARTAAAAACSLSGSGRADGETMVRPWNGECVGYSDSSSFVFENPPAVDEGNAQQELQDERMKYDEEQIFRQNIEADNDQGPGRPVVELVYFAGLTAARGNDYDPGQAEELEGLMIAQRVALGGTSGPLLKVVVANGGSEMQDAVSVTRMLVSLFATGRHLLGVVGLDRSTQAVKQAIDMFDAHKIPMVATTLSADGIGDGDPYYFQSPPANYQEAHLILEYIENVVPLYFEQPRKTYNSHDKAQPTKILIYWPSPDRADLYITTLVADLRREEPQFSGRLTVAITHNFGTWLCGASMVDIYAGRQDWPPGNPDDTFGQFLLTIATDCVGNEPFVIADDGVTRFIVDPAQLTQQELSELAVSYVSQAPAILGTGNDCLSVQKARQLTDATATMKEFCDQYALIVGDLSRLPAQQGQRITVPWTGERVGLAYDAAELFLKAEINYMGSIGKPIIRSSVPGEFEASSYGGVTGTVDFGTSHIGVNSPTEMPLAIVRIQLNSSTATPTCAYSYSAQGVQQFYLVPTSDTCPPGFG
jgi:hypothetical protein